jgi:hypothetical protein
MQLTIVYTGDLGSGEAHISISEEASLKDLIDAFHTSIDQPDFYNIQAGAPPHRRTIAVKYQHYVNEQRIRDKDMPLSNLELKDGDTLKMEIGGGGMVD